VFFQLTVKKVLESGLLYVLASFNLISLDNQAKNEAFVTLVQFACLEISQLVQFKNQAEEEISRLTVATDEAIEVC